MSLIYVLTYWVMRLVGLQVPTVWNPPLLTPVIFGLFFFYVGDAAVAYGLITITAIIVVLLWGLKTLARFRYGRKRQPNGLDQMR